MKFSSKKFSLNYAIPVSVGLIFSISTLIFVQFIAFPEDGIDFSILRHFGLGTIFIIWILTYILILKLRDLFWLSVFISFLAGFILLALSGLYRYLFFDHFESWAHAISGPAKVTTIMTLDGSVLALMAMATFLVAYYLVASRKKN